jgi:hypothetical protein
MCINLNINLYSSAVLSNHDHDMDCIHRSDICRNDSTKANQFVIAQNVR